MRRTGPWATHAALIAVQIAFASQAVEAKIAMTPLSAGGEGVPPAALAMARMLAAAVAFQALARIGGWLTPTSRRDQLTLAGLSIIGISANQGLFLLGLRSTTAMVAVLVSVTIPVFAAGIAVIVGQERPNPRTFIGIFCAVLGIVCLTGVRALDRGALIVALNSLSYASYVVFSRNIVRRLGAWTAITWLFTWGALLFAPIGAATLSRGVPVWTPRGWAFVAYIVLVPTMVAYLANAWALGRSSVSLVAVYIYLQPLLAAVLAWVQLGQRLTVRLGVASFLVLLGVLVVATRRASLSAPPLPGATTG